jgi:hypothetical protein
VLLLSVWVLTDFVHFGIVFAVFGDGLRCSAWRADWLVGRIEMVFMVVGLVWSAGNVKGGAPVDIAPFGRLVSMRSSQR